jgi:hypothetical protein
MTDFYYFVGIKIRRLRDNSLDFIPFGLNDTILNDYESQLEYIDKMPGCNTENYSLKPNHFLGYSAQHYFLSIISNNS